MINLTLCLVKGLIFFLVTWFSSAHVIKDKIIFQRMFRNSSIVFGGNFLKALFFFFFSQGSQWIKPASWSVISREVNTPGIDYVHFIEEKLSFLYITALAKIVVEDSSECAFSCLENLACFSFRVAAFPDKAGKFTCEILTSDKYNSSENYLPSKIFHHFRILVRTS